jgi:hypothetical protein
MVKGVGFSLLVTGIVSSTYQIIKARFRSIFNPAMHLFGFGIAIMSGTLYGAITSTRFTL